MSPLILDLTVTGFAGKSAQKIIQQFAYQDALNQIVINCALCSKNLTARGHGCLSIKGAYALSTGRFATVKIFSRLYYGVP